LDKTRLRGFKHEISELATPFPIQDYRLVFSLCPLRSLRLCGKKRI
jgi:hypothetical protein